ncbi:MAG TPA: hypothetical protein VIQ74_07820 [Gemmatimonadaceae bacterium]
MISISEYMSDLLVVSPFISSDSLMKKKPLKSGKLPASKRTSLPAASPSTPKRVRGAAAKPPGKPWATSAKSGRRGT